MILASQVYVLSTILYYTFLLLLRKMDYLDISTEAIYAFMPYVMMIYVLILAIEFYYGVTQS
jgi:hypothetical protein